MSGDGRQNVAFLGAMMDELNAPEPTIRPEYVRIAWDIDTNTGHQALCLQRRCLPRTKTAHNQTIRG